MVLKFLTVTSICLKPRSGQSVAQQSFGAFGPSKDLSGVSEREIEVQRQREVPKDATCTVLRCHYKKTT